MMDVTLDFRDELTPVLKALGREAPNILDEGLKGTATGFRDYARRSLGSMLHSQTGVTYKQLKSMKRRDRPHYFMVWAPSLANIYEHAGGASIRPKRRTARNSKRPPALKFVVGGKTVFTKRVHLARRPFMSTAYQTCDFGRTFDAEATAAIARARARLGLT
jgi:hypothetical protein